MLYVLDTCMCSFCLGAPMPRGAVDREALLKRVRQVGVHRLRVSFVTVAELYRTKKREHVVRTWEFLNRIEELPLTTSTGAMFAKIYSDLRDTPGLRSKLENAQFLKDLWIAANVVGLPDAAVLVTNNERDFDCIAELQIEDWTSS